MRRLWSAFQNTNPIYILVFCLSLLTWAAGVLLTGWTFGHTLVWLAAVGFSLGLAWLAGERVRLGKLEREAQDKIEEQAARTREIQRRLESVVHLNRELIQVEDEQTLVEKALDMVSSLTGAIASSFVPLDELGEPLSAIVQGSLPQPILKAWAEHLASQLVRKTCGKCQELHADAGQICPLLVGPFAEAFSVYCLPLERNARWYGLLNVYFGPHHDLNPETRGFLESLLAEMGNALQTVRLRHQELTTLRQLQLARANRHDLAAALGDLLENLRRTFEMDAARLSTRALSAGQADYDLSRGDWSWVSPEAVREISQKALEGGMHASNLADGQAGCSFQAIPLVLPGGTVLGVIVLASKNDLNPTNQQIEVMQTIAAQAALLIESQRARESLEYAIVMQERSRLAREIHDGLAQTLAYLKLQTAQMQRALTQNDIHSLKNILDQNYASLAEAYLDARQSIDHLRLNPQQGIEHWLEQVVKDFETLSGVPVNFTIEKRSVEIPPEVQAQLVRIVQEIFTNIRKHAHARHAWINLKEWEGDFILEVGDDGQGFQPDDVPGLTQYGLRGMRERAELIGADFQVVSRQGEGTVVSLRLPFQSWEVFQ